MKAKLSFMKITSNKSEINKINKIINIAAVKNL